MFPIGGYGLHLATEEYRMLVRLYFPRTYRDVMGYDSSTRGGSADFLSPSQVSQLMKAVIESGKGALGDLGGVSVTMDNQLDQLRFVGDVPK